MELVLIIFLALIIGFRVGRSSSWATWHGPVGAVLVVPMALAVGFDPLLSVVGPVCLGGGFLVARFSA